jgi:hypothetical protein
MMNQISESVGAKRRRQWRRSSRRYYARQKSERDSSRKSLLPLPYSILVPHQVDPNAHHKNYGDNEHHHGDASAFFAPAVPNALNPVLLLANNHYKQTIASELLATDYFELDDDKSSSSSISSRVLDLSDAMSWGPSDMVDPSPLYDSDCEGGGFEETFLEKCEHATRSIITYNNGAKVECLDNSPSFSAGIIDTKTMNVEFSTNESSNFCGYENGVEVRGLDEVPTFYADGEFLPNEACVFDHCDDAITTDDESYADSFREKQWKCGSCGLLNTVSWEDVTASFFCVLCQDFRLSEIRPPRRLAGLKASMAIRGESRVDSPHQRGFLEAFDAKEEQDSIDRFLDRRGIKVTPTKGSRKAGSITAEIRKENEAWARKFTCLDSHVATTVKEACEYAMLVFPPHDEKATHQYLSRHLLMGNVACQSDLLAPVAYSIQRNTAQLYAYRGLKNSFHFGIGPTGAERLQQTDTAYDLLKLPNNSNSDFDPRNPRKPIVLNGTVNNPVVTDFKSHIEELLEDAGLLLELLTVVTPNKKRSTACANVGITGTDAKKWLKRHQFDNPMPGMMGTVGKLSPKLARWFGLLGIILGYTFYNEVLPPDILQKHFGSDQYRNQVGRDRLAPLLGLSPEEAEFFYWEAITIVFDAITPGMHMDELNDHREGREYCTVGSVIINLFDYGYKDTDAVVIKARAMNMHPECMMIVTPAYTREVAGIKADQLRHAATTGDMAVSSFLLLVSDRGDSLLDSDLLTESHTGCLVDQIKGGLTFQPKSDYDTGKVFRRPEGLTKQFFFDSTLHCVFQLMFNFRPLVSEDVIIEIIAFVCHEMSGQDLTQAVLSKFVSDRWRGGAKGSFQTALIRYGFYRVACMEVIYLRERKRGKPNQSGWFLSTFNRYRTSHRMLCTDLNSKESVSEIKALVGAIKAAINILRSTQISNAKGVVSLCLRDKIALKAHESMTSSNVHGLGHFTAMHVIQFAGFTTLVRPEYTDFAVVDASSRKLGPTIFLNKHSNCSSSSLKLTQPEIEKAFDDLGKGLSKAGFKKYARRKRVLENGCCIIGRGLPKKDSIFMDPDGRHQNHFLAKSDSKNRVQLCLLFRREWFPLADIFTPFHEVDNVGPATTAASEWAVDGSSWLSGLPRDSFPQDPFGL